jgi:hypothetical protein
VHSFHRTSRRGCRRFASSRLRCFLRQAPGTNPCGAHHLRLCGGDTTGDEESRTLLVHGQESCHAKVRY